ncbi:MAG: hypothetical protein RMN51_01290 [Verrucomicrobiota bacterium]|nr:hypothetical protein [Limisphaera sp.]MDW8380732.1 hypothetical protein [Verrucomicrobiota bacterium]
MAKRYIDDQLFMELCGPGFSEPDHFVWSAVRDTSSRDGIFKLVDGSASSSLEHLRPQGMSGLCRGVVVVLTDPDPAAVNDIQRPDPVVPRWDSLRVEENFDSRARASSLSGIWIPAR